MISVHNDELESLSKSGDDFFDQFDPESPVGVVAPVQLDGDDSKGEQLGSACMCRCELGFPVVA